MGLFLMPSIVRTPCYALCVRRGQDRTIPAVNHSLPDAILDEVFSASSASPCVRFVVSLMRRLVT